MDVITVYGLQFSSGEGITFSLDSGLQNIPLKGVQFLGSFLWHILICVFLLLITMLNLHYLNFGRGDCGMSDLHLTTSGL